MTIIATAIVTVVLVGCTFGGLLIRDWWVIRQIRNS